MECIETHTDGTVVEELTLDMHCKLTYRPFN